MREHRGRYWGSEDLDSAVEESNADSKQSASAMADVASASSASLVSGGAGASIVASASVSASGDVASASSASLVSGGAGAGAGASIVASPSVSATGDVGETGADWYNQACTILREIYTLGTELEALNTSLELKRKSGTSRKEEKEWIASFEGEIKEKRDEICKLGNVLYNLASDKIVEVLFDEKSNELRNLLIESKPLITHRSDDLDFWNAMAKLAKDIIRLNIVKKHIGEVTFLFQLTSLDFEKDLENRTILFLGEDDFSFTDIFSYAYPEKSSRILATEYRSLTSVLKRHLMTESMISVLEKGVIAAFGVNAEILDTYTFLTAEKFERIQFNCPYADERPEAEAEAGAEAGAGAKAGTAYTRPKTKRLISLFVSTAKSLLLLTGRLHISIQQPKEPVKGKEWGKKQYQQAFGLTPKLVADHALTFIKAMGDIEKRYAAKIENAALSLGVEKIPEHSIEFEGPICRYKPYTNGSNKRINQFIFKPTDKKESGEEEFFDYKTDDEDSDDEEVKPAAAGAGKA